MPKKKKKKQFKLQSFQWGFIIIQIFKVTKSFNLIHHPPTTDLTNIQGFFCVCVCEKNIAILITLLRNHRKNEKQQWHEKAGTWRYTVNPPPNTGFSCSLSILLMFNKDVQSVLVTCNNISSLNQSTTASQRRTVGLPSLLPDLTFSLHQRSDFCS